MAPQSSKDAPKSSQRLPELAPDESIVLSGVSGRFPLARNVKEFGENLYNQVDTTTDIKERWGSSVHPEVPKRMGTIYDLDQFDAGIFGVPKKQADFMEPMCRMLLECTYEAILDAGMHPSDFEGTRTAVIIGSSTCESEQAFYEEIGLQPKNFCIVGSVRSTLSSRISYWLKTVGTSYVADTACGSSLYAFEQAYRSLRENRCDYAIVGGSNLCMNPVISLQFARLGVLSKDGSCKSFDDTANGYVRSEGVTVMIMQRAKTAMRIYAKVVHAKTNCDGYKVEGITYPSGEAQKVLLDDFYEECGVAPSSITYVEAHGTGTHVGDPEELKTIDQVFCTGRSKPLHIGSVKSNIGHNEPASGLSALTKVILGFEQGFVPPNRNFSIPRRGVEGLREGRMLVVSEKIPWPDNNGLVGASSFGFGGGNCHVLLKWNEKTKIKEGLPTDDIPRLICVSARNELGLSNILEDLQTRALDAEYVALYHHIFKKSIEGNLHRGYALISKQGQKITAEKYSADMENFSMYFGGVNENEPLSDFMELPTFKSTFQKFQDTLITHDLNYDLSMVIAQIAVYETIKTLGAIPLSYYGASVGILASNYAENNLSFEEVAVLAFFFGLDFKEDDLEVDGIVLERIQNFIQQLLAHRNPRLPQAPETRFARDLTEGVLSKNCNGLNLPQDVLILQCGSIKHSVNKNNKIDVLSRSSYALMDFLNVLGRLYTMGHDLNLVEIYPKVAFPVSRGTPMISPLIKLNRTRSYRTQEYSKCKATAGYKKVMIDSNASSWSFIQGHVIDGRNLFPATGYLYLVWELFAATKSYKPTELSVVFENVKFIRAVNLPKEGEVALSVVVLKESGNFEVSEGETVMVTGRVSEKTDVIQTLPLGSSEVTNLILKENDIYKELRLRGYNYSGLFKGLKGCNLEGTEALLEWNDNWIAFLDNMLQLLILQEDTRSLYVPTGIERLSINLKEHDKCCTNNKSLMPVYAYKEAGIIRSGGAELRGLRASAISKRKPRGEPVLECYKFVPNEATLSTKESIRVNMQLILENVASMKVKVVEVIDKETVDALSPLILDALEDLPLIQPDVSILSSESSIIIENVKIENRDLVPDGSALLVIGTRLLGRPELLEQALAATKTNGFILTQENTDFDHIKKPLDMQLLTIHATSTGKLCLLQKHIETPQRTTVINISSCDTFDWLKIVQKAAANDENVILYAQDQPTNGIIGLTNCIRKERGGEKIRCIFLDETAPKFEATSPFYAAQIAKGFAVNIYADHEWGTYRHLLLDEARKMKTNNSYMKVTVPGDLSSMIWVEGSLACFQSEQEKSAVVDIHYSALNFRDVMTASGRIPVETNRLAQTSTQGFEYSGVDIRNENRVMGMTSCGALSTKLIPDLSLMWQIPDDWTLEEAASIPVVYCTSLYAMLLVGKMQRGESILIHSGTGGVGQAAINIALHYGCTVFTTVGTKEKRKFIKENFPQIPDSHIGNSRDCSFEQMIQKETSGKGVDLVLNSLAEEKLQTSVRCLAANGRFLEIGKFDLMSNNPLYLSMLLQGKTFHGIMIDRLLNEDPHIKRLVHGLLKGCIDEGIVKPLPCTVFYHSEVEQAFRYMMAGKHIGKVLIKIRNDTEDLPTCMPQFSCDSNQSNVILGGLGGFGLELADWLVVRGARKLVLTSRRGVTNGYQALRIKTWKLYGVDVLIATDDITSKEGCMALIKKANGFAPVENIFNLAVVLLDKTLENQTEDDFRASFAPKALATHHLDEISREMCPNLRNFVIFSSVSCGRGNGGQTNYGMANSVMERVCEQRKKIGLPALAIQWGAVGDVGLVAEMTNTGNELVIGGTLQQKITSCLGVLDTLMKQEEVIVSSMVVAEKRAGNTEQNIVEAVANILGIRDTKTVSPHTTLPEIGMDSMMGVEIKQTLEREYDVFLTPQDIRTLTFSRLQEILVEKQEGTLEKENEIKHGLDFLFRFIESEEHMKNPTVEMQTATLSNRAPTVFFLPGYEGTSSIFKSLARKMRAKAFCFQYSCENPEESIAEMAKNILPRMQQHLMDSDNFLIVAHSFGALVALEVAALLEEQGFSGKLLLIDGAPHMIKKLVMQQLPMESDVEMQISLLFKFLLHMFPLKTLMQHKTALEQCTTYEHRIDLLMEKLPSDETHSKPYQKQLAICSYKRVIAMKKYQPSFHKLTSQVALFKAKIQTVHDMADDFNLSEICQQKVDVKSFEGDHVSILENQDLAAEINLGFGDDVIIKESLFQTEITQRIEVLRQ